MLLVIVGAVNLFAGRGAALLVGDAVYRVTHLLGVDAAVLLVVSPAGPAEGGLLSTSSS